MTETAAPQVSTSDDECGPLDFQCDRCEHGRHTFNGKACKGCDGSTDPKTSNFKLYSPSNN
jgi:hypothetical protein